MNLLNSLTALNLTREQTFVIASACGYPKDINFYQTGAKTLFNAIGAAKPGEGVVIIVSQCSEGWGNPDTEKFAMEFDNMLDREIFLRDNFGIGRYVGYRIFEVATQVHFIIVSDMDPAGFSKTDIIPLQDHRGSHREGTRDHRQREDVNIYHALRSKHNGKYGYLMLYKVIFEP